MKQDKETIAIVGTSGELGQSLVRNFGLSYDLVLSADPSSKSISSTDNIRQIQTNVTKPVELEHLANEIIELSQTYKFKGLIYNSGVSFAEALEHTQTEQLKEVFQINCFGFFNLMKLLSPILKKEKNIHICHIGSITQRLDSPFLSAYAASKSATDSLCRSLRREFKANSLNVTNVIAGPIQTAMLQLNIDKTQTAKDEYYRTGIRRLENILKQANEKGLTPDQASEKILWLFKTNYLPNHYYLGKYARVHNIIDRYLPEKLRAKLIYK